MTNKEKMFKGVAHHEAGHAVLAYLTNMPIKTVKIFPERWPVPFNALPRTIGAVTFCQDKWPEWADFESPSFDKKRATMYAAKTVSTCFAGDLAKSLYSGRMVRPESFEDGPIGSDAELIDYICFAHLKLSVEAMCQWTARLWFITLEILHMPEVWAAVSAVAEQLFRRKTLKAAEVCALVEQELARGAAYDYAPLRRRSRSVARLAPRLKFDGRKRRQQ